MSSTLEPDFEDLLTQFDEAVGRLFDFRPGDKQVEATVLCAVSLAHSALSTTLQAIYFRRGDLNGLNLQQGYGRIMPRVFEMLPLLTDQSEYALALADAQGAERDVIKASGQHLSTQYKDIAQALLIQLNAAIDLAVEQQASK